MPIAKITGQGLFGIGLSVALLWSCLIGERILLRDADAGRSRVVRELKRLQQRSPQPIRVNAPVPMRGQRDPTALA